MTKQKMLEYIYKAIPSEKNLGNEDVWDIRVNFIFIWDIIKYLSSQTRTEQFENIECNFYKYDMNQILHNLNKWLCVNSNTRVQKVTTRYTDESLWKLLDEPIDKQSNECIEYIYNLIK